MPGQQRRPARAGMAGPARPARPVRPLPRGYGIAAPQGFSVPLGIFVPVRWRAGGLVCRRERIYLDPLLPVSRREMTETMTQSRGFRGGKGGFLRTAAQVTTAALVLAPMLAALWA